MNKNLDKQKEIAKFMDQELKKVQDKVLTLKYVYYPIVILGNAFKETVIRIIGS